MKIDRFMPVVVRVVLWVVVPLYITSMVIYPFYSGGSLIHVLKVWHNWQGFNVGVIAFLASVFALSHSLRHFEHELKREKRQREREFIAARAFLPGALSDASGYLISSASILKFAWDVKPLEATIYPAGTRLDPPPMPELSDSVRNIFRDCIRHGSPDIAQRLADILMHMQVSNSRVARIREELAQTLKQSGGRFDVKDNIYYAGNIQALINQTFPFARGDGELDVSEVNRDSMIEGIQSLEIGIETVDQMVPYVESKFP